MSKNEFKARFKHVGKTNGQGLFISSRDELGKSRINHLFRRTHLLAAMTSSFLYGGAAFADTIINNGQSVTVTASLPAAWNNTYGLTVGDTSSGSLLIKDGGTATTTGPIVIGNTASANGTVNVTGAGSGWNTGNYFTVGNAGKGALTISDGGIATAGLSSTTIGGQTGSTGSVVVSGAGSQWNTGYIVLGSKGNGSLTISNGGSVNSANPNYNSYIGNDVGSTGTLIITGAGSQWTGTTYHLYLGGSGNSIVKISDGGLLQDKVGMMAVSAGSTSLMEVSGAGSKWQNDYNLTVGNFGSATMIISDGGVVNSLAFSSVASNIGSTGIITVTGSGSQWNTSGNYAYLTLGYAGNAELAVSDGGTVNSNYGVISRTASATGSATVSGADSAWNIDNEFTVGYGGNGTLTISDRGVVNDKTAYIGRDANSTGRVYVSGTGSQWNTTLDYLTVGDAGNAILAVSDGGTVNSAYGVISRTASATGSATVSGADSAWNIDNEFTVGHGGSGTLTISDSAVVTSGSAYIGRDANSTGSVDVSGAGSQWNNAQELTVGHGSNGTLTVSDSAVVTSGAAYIGRDVDSTGNVDVSGAGSQWNNADKLTIGNSGNGTLTLSDRGSVSSGSMDIAVDPTASGTLNIGNGSRSGTLNALSINGGAGSATVNFNHSDDIDFSSQMTGSLTVNQMNDGATTLTSANQYSGETNVSAGTLRAGLAGAFSAQSNFSVETGGILDLAGYSQATAGLRNDGVVNFNGAPGTVLTVSGDYVGNNGLLNFNTVLHNDASLTDKMNVIGSTSGTTRVSVTNAGGSGAYTLNGIELIKVGGQSDGEFTQAGRIVAGGYDYKLVRGTGENAGNWYLTNLAPTPDPTPDPNVEPIPDNKGTGIRPEYGSYTANLAAANTMFVTRLHDRLGEVQYTDALTGEQKVTSMWLRAIGGHNRSRDESGDLKTQSDRYVVQLGGDIAQWSNNDLDRLHLGIMAGYGNSHSNTTSHSGYGSEGRVDGYNIGLYSTWFANEQDKTGVYVDSWVQYGWFNNSVKGDDIAEENYKSSGVTASLESGYTFKIGEKVNSAQNTDGYFIQPVAQIIWMGVKADDHKEANGTQVSGNGDGNIMTRLGVRAYMQGHHASDDGKDRLFEPFIEANWIHNTNDFSTTMNGMTVSQAGTNNIAELKTGVEGQINKNLNLWGNVGQQIGDKGYSDTAVTFGVKVMF